MSGFLKTRQTVAIHTLALLVLGFYSGASAAERPANSKPAVAKSVAAQPATEGNHLSRSQRRAIQKQQKQALAELESTAVVAEVLALDWNPAPLYGNVGDIQKIGLEKVFDETAKHNLSVLQANAQIQYAEVQAKELIENPFILLNPVQMGLLKQAGAANIEAAKLNAQAVRQKALLESATMYSALTQAYLAKYLAFQAIEQGRNQLKLEEQHFVSGDSDRFGLTQTQMALIDRYNKYLSADDAYYAASLALGNHLDFPEERALVPEEVSLRSEINMVPTLKLLPEDLTLAKAQKASLSRPDIQASKFKREALQKLIKTSSGQEKHKREADLRMLDMQAEKAIDTVSATISRAFAQCQTAQKSLQLAQQRYDLAREFVRQLGVSNKAGFSSTKDVLDGQLELARANSALIEARLNKNLAQIQLTYEMGLLQADLLSHPLSPNAL